MEEELAELQNNSVVFPRIHVKKPSGSGKRSPCRGDWVSCHKGCSRLPERSSGPSQNPYFYISHIPPQTRKTIRLSIDAISGYFRPRYASLQPKRRKNWRNCKTIVSFFREFMSENLPEPANGARIVEIWSHLFHALLPFNRRGNRLIPGPDYPGCIPPPGFAGSFAGTVTGSPCGPISVMPESPTLKYRQFPCRE